MKKLFSLCVSAALVFCLSACSESEEQKNIRSGNEFMDFVQDFVQERIPNFGYDDIEFDGGLYTCKIGTENKDIDVNLSFDENSNISSFSISKYDIEAYNLVQTVNIMESVYIPMMSQIPFSEETRSKLIEGINNYEDNFLSQDETSDVSYTISYESPLYSTADDMAVSFKKPMSGVTHDDKDFDTTGLELVIEGSYSILVLTK